MKKIYKICLAVLLISLIVISIFFIHKKIEDSKIAYRGLCGDNVEWLLDKEGTLTIRRASIFGGKCKIHDYDDCEALVDEPGSNGAPWYNTSLIKKVIIENGITEIGGCAFYNLKCKNVIISDSVEIIRNGAFMDSSVQNVKLPKNLKVIEKMAFSGCSNLQEITIPPNVTEWEESSFGVSGIRMLKISEGVEKIGDSAFGGCENLEKVILPSTLKHLGHDTFHNCEKLKEIKIPEKVEKIPTSCFDGCTKLEKVELPKNLKVIREYAFVACDSLKEIEIPNADVIIEEAALPKKIKINR